MTFLTIFTAPKPFTDPHIALIQQNAIQSWQKLGNDVSVILVGDEDGIADAAETYGVLHIPQVRRNTMGTPLISSIFHLAEQNSNSPLLAYVNADILLLPDFLDAARKVSRQSAAFLLLGQRWDLNVAAPIDFSGNWEASLQAMVRQQARLHPPSGSDYFVFRREAFSAIPDFAVGRAGWDNWMIYHARKQGWLVIDATPTMKVIHQSHDYRHLPGGKPHYDLEETRVNAALGGGLGNMYLTLDANRELVDGRIRMPRLTRIRILRMMERWIRPADDSQAGFRSELARKFRRMRRKLVKEENENA